MELTHPRGPQSFCDILIVDDDPGLRSALEQFLKRSGYLVQSAADGRAALKRLEQLQVKLIITDLFMPDFDGFELILHLRRAAANLEIVVMTGDGLSDLDVFLVAVRQLGVKHTLTKPFTLVQLLNVVQQSIGPAK